MNMRETYVIDVAKTIYPKIAFPSHRGGFEKKFIQFVDSDSKVKCFMKINEYHHEFATVIYIRDDGMLSNYYPDFIVKIDLNVFKWLSS